VTIQDNLAEPAGNRLVSFNPATGERIGEVPVAGPAEVEAAVLAATRAQPQWAALPGAERARILRKAAAILRERNDQLAALETRDTGKPIQETRVVDVSRALGDFAARAERGRRAH
jgi:betaine-aldehyde dehydrogenase